MKTDRIKLALKILAGAVGLIVWCATVAWFLFGPGKGRSPKSAAEALIYSDAVAAVDAIYALYADGAPSIDTNRCRMPSLQRIPGA